MNLSGQRVSVLGLGASGFESAQFLKRRGAQVFVSERSRSDGIAQYTRRLDSAGISYEVGTHSSDRILKSDLVIVSPGISPREDVYQSAKKSGIPLWSEIELAYQFCPSKIVAVTGTNGKTTVSTLLHQIYAANGYDVVSCGNIGNTFIGEVPRLTENSLVIVEVSSFQLENTHRFRPHVAVLLNLSENHLDWHGDYEHYKAAKWRIFANQEANDYAVINSDDLECMRKIDSIKSQIVYFNNGEMNNPNDSACAAVSDLDQLDSRKVKSVLSHFQGVPHRLETVLTQDGIRYVNDSKSTTVAALRWALERAQGKIVLVMGGRHKGGDFGQLRSLISSSVRFVVLMGEATALIENAFADLAPMTRASNLTDAVRLARAVAKSGDTVLLSPACSSFDQFQDYMDRGDQFKMIVRQLHTKPKETFVSKK